MLELGALEKQGPDSEHMFKKDLNLALGSFHIQRVSNIYPLGLI